jgi:hypothetical protein
MGQRKVRWISWERMCVGKRDGGMGFRHHDDFNQALLAKQAWRLVTSPESLCAKVLRARYYKQGSIMDAKCPKRGSYTWRSILYGRDLLKEGLIWRVGDGKKRRADRAGTSYTVDEHKGWLALWAADVSGKTKVHCWRLAQNGLAVGGELQRRKIKDGVRCIACNREETLHHRFWSCPHSSRTWELLREQSRLALATPPADCRSHAEFRLWLLEWIARLWSLL